MAYVDTAHYLDRAIEFGMLCCEFNRPPPAPLAHDDGADGRFVDAVRHDLFARDGHPTANAVRMLWTGDHLDPARQLQGGLVEPARAITDQQTLRPFAGIHPWRPARG